MPDQTRIVRPGPSERTVRTENGEVLTVPEGWSLLEPGDPGLTRRVKADGPSWTVQEKRGRKIFTRGVWAPTETIETIRQDLQDERATPQYARKRAADVARREREQREYVGEFRESVLAFLAFHSQYAEVAGRLADAVTAHATPVGSGTVARTERIPVEERAEAAVIAWMRHQTTAYDRMSIPRVKGMRRDVRRMLAQRSKTLLESYRRGLMVDPMLCPLQRALAKGTAAPASESANPALPTVPSANRPPIAESA